MWWQIKYSPYSIDSISNNDNASSVLYLNSLINAIFDCKQFCLSNSNVDSMLALEITMTVSGSE